MWRYGLKMETRMSAVVFLQHSWRHPPELMLQNACNAEHMLGLDDDCIQIRIGLIPLALNQLSNANFECPLRIFGVAKANRCQDV